MKKVIVVNSFRALDPSQDGRKRFWLKQDKSTGCVIVLDNDQSLASLGIVATQTARPATEARKAVKDDDGNVTTPAQPAQAAREAIAGSKVVMIQRDITTKEGVETKAWYFEQVASAAGAAAVKEAASLALDYDEEYQRDLLKAQQLAKASAVVRPAAIPDRDVKAFFEQGAI